MPRKVIGGLIQAAAPLSDPALPVAKVRQAAIDALKQYEYAPATQGGRAVASKVTVTIKFWFDP